MMSHRSWTKARRKREIARMLGYEPYDNLHQYSKNKVTCNCPMCKAKTNNRGRNSMEPNTNYKISDKRKIERLLDDDYFYEDESL